MLATLPRKIFLSETFIRLKQLRELHKLTQRELADMIGTSQGTIAAWETGRVQDLDLGSIRKIAPAYGMTPEALTRYLNGEQPAPTEPTKQPELYDSLAVQSVPMRMVRVAEVTIAAGLESWRSLGDYPVPLDVVGNRDAIMVRVVGNCLEPDIQAGDMALIDRGNLSPRTGALVAVLLEDGQLVMKRFSISPEDRRPMLTDNTGTVIRPSGARIVGTIIHINRTVY